MNQPKIRTDYIFFHCFWSSGLKRKIRWFDEDTVDPRFFTVKYLWIFLLYLTNLFMEYLPIYSFYSHAQNILKHMKIGKLKYPD